MRAKLTPNRCTHAIARAPVRARVRASVHVACCMLHLHVACCMLHVACRLSYVACRMLYVACCILTTSTGRDGTATCNSQLAENIVLAGSMTGSALVHVACRMLHVACCI